MNIFKFIVLFTSFFLVFIFWLKGEIPTFLFIWCYIGLSIGMIPKEGFKKPDEE